MVIAIIMVIVGAVAMIQLPTAQFPDIAPPEIFVQANYPGADAETLEQSVATPIEQQISGVDKMLYMYSLNANNGQSAIYVDFDVSTDPNTDQVLTQMRQTQAAGQMPAEVTQGGITVQKSVTSPLMLVSLYSQNGSYDNIYLANYAYINLADELTRVQGVGRVQVFGAGQYAMRIWVKPDQLAKLGVTVPEITQAITTQNTVNPAGQIGGEPVPHGQQFNYAIRAQGRLVTADDFGNIIVRSNPDGSTLRVKDVARVELGAQTYNLTSRYNGKPSAIVAIYQLPGSNAVSTAKAVRARMLELQKRFPPDCTYEIPLDTTKAVSVGIHEIIVTLFESLALVVIVVYIFLQGWRATLIPLMAVPVSLIGTFVVFPLLGFSINTLSLFGLVLAIGLVVDDAIVVVEAVEHHIEEGMSPRDATIKAMQEVSGPVIAIALILAAVFIPTAFIPGITGRLYQQFAVTIAISVVFSAFNALTLSPALCALLLRPKKESRGPLAGFFRWFNRVFRRTTDGYVKTSGILIRRSAFSLLLLVVAGVGAVMVGGKLESSFLPEEDQGYAFVALQLPDAASLERTDIASRKVEEKLRQVPGVQSVVSVVGFSLLSQVQSSYNAFFFVSLKDWDERKTPDQKYATILHNIAAGLSQVQDGIAFSFSPPAIPGIGTSGGATFVLEDHSGSGTDHLAANVDKFMAAARKRPEMAAVLTTFLPHVPQLYVDVDREKVMRQQVNIGDVYETMQTFMGGFLVNYFNRFGRQWQVYVEAEGDYRTRPEALGQFYVANKSGTMVPLSALTHIKSITGPEFIMRHNEYESAQINAIAAPGYSSAQVMNALETVFAETMPKDMGYDYMGMSYQEKLAQKGVPTAAVYGLSLLFVFLILAALYESWTLPFSVLLSTPIAVFGAYLTLYLRHFEDNVYAQIGLVMLIGLSAKNAILIVEFAKLEFEEGKTLVEAALGAARLRLRPILMTAFAFILGCVPLWIAEGSGAVGRQALGTTVIGGMLAASLLAIFLIPVAFVVVERVGLMFQSKRQASSDAEMRTEGGVQ
jgi:hydrophobe/amphiphile efflux-1 (HAE1) family protein